VKINRAWAMPSSETFGIPPIHDLIMSVIEGVGSDAVIVDPFARNATYGNITNDIDPETGAMYHMDALEFLTDVLESDSADLVLFDPPYSPRQVSEVYKKLGMSVNMETTQSSFWSDLKTQVQRICKPGARCITFGWNSGGIGESYGFRAEQILLVAHGGWHNDTICTVEVRDSERQSDLLNSH
jgi:hypothetical protein